MERFYTAGTDCILATKVAVLEIFAAHAALNAAS